MSRAIVVAASFLVASVSTIASPGRAQEGARRPDAQAVARAHSILAQIRRDLLENYYDSTFHGINLEQRYRAYDAALDTASTTPQLTGIVAQFMMDLNDSHTWFGPPSLVARIEYGWNMRPVGDSIYVSFVKEGSDAQQKGLAVGDRVVAIDGMRPSRQNLWIINYAYYQLSPRPGMRLVIQKPDGTQRTLEILARITRGLPVVDYNDPAQRHILFNECVECTRIPLHATLSLGDTVLIWRMASFVDDDEGSIDRWIREARRHRALILDLRDNGGGEEQTMLRMIGSFFDRDVTVGTLQLRRERRPLVARGVREPFQGMLVVLLNSSSGSASEVTARTLQIEERAVIVGDRSAGAVMRSRGYTRDVGGIERRLVYGVVVTDADLLMPDGSRIEGRGVSPHEVVLPGPADMLAKNDPQLSHALSLVGVTRTPVEAGQMLRAMLRTR